MSVDSQTKGLCIWAAALKITAIVYACEGTRIVADSIGLQSHWHRWPKELSRLVHPTGEWVCKQKTGAARASIHCCQLNADHTRFCASSTLQFRLLSQTGSVTRDGPRSCCGQFHTPHSSCKSAALGAAGKLYGSSDHRF